MSNCMIGFPNNIDSATLSGGSYNSGLALANLQTRQLKEVARSTDTAKTSTFVSIDLGAAKATRALAVVNHNLSLAAKYRIRGSNEGAVVNLRPWSETPANAAWGKTNMAGVGSPTYIGPSGLAGASYIVEDTSNGIHEIRTPTVTLNAGDTYTESIYAKQGARQYLRLGFSGLFNSTGATAYAVFDLSSGTIPLVSIPGVTARMQAIGTDGWYRCSVTFTVTNSNTYTNIVGIQKVYNEQSGYQGDGSSGIYIFGSQLQSGSRATSYITNNSAGTASNTQGAIDSWQSYDYDSGWADVWPTVYPYGTREWEDANWFGGKYLPEEIVDFPTTLVHTTSINTICRYWRIDFDDTTNAAGYVQFGRLFIGPVWQPKVNMSYGASIAWETNTEVSQSLSGSESFDYKRPFRVSRYKLEAMDRNEGMANAFELQRRAGVDKEVLWVEDPDATLHAHRTRFLGRLRTLSPIEYPYFDNNVTAFEIKELQ